MKLALKLTLAIAALLFAAYHAYFYALPSVTIVNNTAISISDARVSLPSSGLGFGEITANNQNSLYYALAQADGSYQYRITLADNTLITGSCGYVTANELHKRVVIIVNADRVHCE